MRLGAVRAAAGAIARLAYVVSERWSSAPPSDTGTEACPAPPDTEVDACPAPAEGAVRGEATPAPSTFSAAAAVATAVSGCAPPAGGALAASKTPPDLAAREYFADFDTATRQLQAVSLTPRPDAVVLERTTCFTLGPIDVGDISLGVEARVWRARAAVGVVYVARWIDGTGWDEAELFTYAGSPIDELSLAFDQGGAPVIAAERAGHVWIRFFDPLLGANSFADLGAGRTPLVVLDDLDTSLGDVQVLYLSATGELVHRQERDRYQVEIATGKYFTASDFLEAASRTQTDRLAVVLSRRDAELGTWSLARVESALFPHRVREPVLLSGAPTAGELRAQGDVRGLREDSALTGIPLSGFLRQMVQFISPREDALLTGQPTGGTLRAVIQTINVREDQKLSGTPQSGTLVAVIVSTSQREDARLTGFPTGGTLA